MALANQVHILVKAVYISVHTNTLGKGRNPSLFPPAMGRPVSLALAWQLV